MPRALVIRAAGTNCDAELCRAFRLAGAEPDLVHLDRLIEDPARLGAYDLIGFPGGFSYGDDVASGRIFAVRTRERLYPALRESIQRGVPMIGVCNGFQVLVQVGLLPGPAAGEPWPADAPPAQRCALADNINARFIDQWVGVRPEANSVCVWTRGLGDDAEPPHPPAASGEPDLRAAIAAFKPASKAPAPISASLHPPISASDLLRLPIAHGEGRFVAASPEVIAELERAGQVALRYTDNVNGSEGGIAGICDASGLIFGLMPHPERYLDWTRHPYWTRLPSDARKGDTPGLRIFRNAVEAAARVPA